MSRQRVCSTGNTWFLAQLGEKVQMGETAFPKERIIVDPMPIPSTGLPIRLHPHEAA